MRMYFESSIISLQSKHFRTKNDTVSYSDYSKYVINAVYLDEIPGRIEAGKYTNTEAFVDEFKWILHNTTIYSARESNKFVLF